jgi:hypothetical protein
VQGCTLLSKEEHSVCALHLPEATGNETTQSEGGRLELS